MFGLEGGDVVLSSSSRDGDYLPEDDDDETTLERITALSEMFPESVRKGTAKTIEFMVKGVKKAYSWGRTGTWFFFSTAIITIAPVLLEVEKYQMEEMQKMQQRQMLLGPNVARS
ncbi:mitochondrial import receptor subunit TOM22 homolog [Folsomia candida]|uniref:Mitochondrial import receptor subunit TOM22 homolog n=1 Tax=Folsomia candida TaxID=158441 RepID=A0A226DF85_FOLCA|nr:mitochondrial import receptor subunit TOM22 homolog [Folsomia candida]OXA43638.1 Mitochondrial import receptor subunit TOM22 [Folsomia candida]